MRTQDPVEVRLQDYRPFPFAIRHVSLAFALDPVRTIVTSRLLIERRQPDGEAQAALVLDGENLDLLDIKIDGKTLEPTAYRVTDTQLVLETVPDDFRLDIQVAINPTANTALSGLYMSGGRFCTQCEAEGFRRITYWPDRPDVMSRFHVRIEADQSVYPTLLSNGNRVAIGNFDDGRHWAAWDDPHAKPSYLFALVAGGFDQIEDSFTTMSGRVVALTIYVDPGDSGRAFYAMDALKRSMKWDEDVFGREYDLDVFNIVAVSDFNFGAMENKGLNIFNSALLLADETTATDADYEAIEAVVAHEYFHNWSGNRVTCRDWFQLSLKEGFTVFRDQEFSADMRSRAVKRIKDVKALRARQFPEDNGPLAHPVRPKAYVKIDNFYTATIYEKGAEVIRLTRELIGAEGFAAGVELYFAENDGFAATIEDWLTALRTGSGHPLEHIERWYDQAGTPNLIARGVWDQPTGTYRLTLSQSTPDTPGQAGKKPVPMPVKLAFFGPEGGQMRLKVGQTQADEWTIPLSQESLTIEFQGADVPPVPSLLRGFSAPVKLDAGYSLDDLALLAACDTDAFVRWEATQTIARRTLLEAASSLGTDAQAPILDPIARAVQGALRDSAADPAFAALLLRLPDVAELMQLQADCDPQALQAGRAWVRQHLADQLDSALDAVYATYDPAQTFSPSAEAAGRRALAAATLDLLSAAGGERAILRADNAFYASRNMTDMMAALDALSHLGGPRFEAALEAFETRWKDVPLVMDKWFSVQAAATSNDPAARFAALRGHEAFTLRNPNRVRALGSAFMMRNPAAFHAANGSGYQLIGALIGDVDGANGALAARLATGFESASRVSRDRKDQALGVIEDLLKRNALSPNTREILSKIATSLR
jgi:aminopeptidase N